MSLGLACLEKESDATQKSDNNNHRRNGRRAGIRERRAASPSPIGPLAPQVRLTEQGIWNYQEGAALRSRSDESGVWQGHREV
jgi:hypothetical protein